MSNWEEVILGEVAEIKGRIGWKGYKKSDLRDSGPVVIGGSNVKNNIHLDLSDLKHLSREKFEESPEIMLQTGDVLLVQRGNGVGDIAYYHGEFKEATINPTMIIISGFKWCSKFLAYYLISSVGQKKLDSLKSGSSIPAIYQKPLGRLKLKIPSLTQQKAIVHILDKLDYKIVLNLKMNKTLEAMAQAIFKSWFVDFDPVRAKIAAKKAGRDPEKAAMAAISGISLEMDWDEIDAALCQKLSRLTEVKQQQLSRTAELFPEELVESELGEVPKGWGFSTIDKEFDVVNGQSPPGSSYNENGEGDPFYQGRTDFGFRFPTQRIFCTEPKRFAKKGDTLLSVRAPVGDLNIAIEDCCIGRGLSALRHKSGSSSYTYYAMKVIQSQIESYEATGTVFGSINQKQLKALDAISPDDTLIEEYHRIAAPIDSQIMNQELMVRELSKLRDTLLPELISGKISV